MNLNPESSPPIPDDSAGQANAAESLSLWGYFVKCLRMYAKFGGRARRREFWGFCYFALIFLLALLFISLVAGNIKPLLMYLFFIIVMYLPFMAVTVRRFHDTGKSGWWSLPFTLLPVTFPISVVMIFTLPHVTWITMIDWVMVYTALAQVFLTPFIFVWGLIWLCRNSQRSSNKYGDCPSDVN